MPVKRKKSPCIYELIDPNTNQVRYVGATFYPYQRYYEHYSRIEIRTKYSGLKEWILNLRKEGKRPILKIVKKYNSDITRKELSEKEKKHTIKISKISNIFNLFYGNAHTDKSREWVRKSNSGRKYSKSTKEKISVGNSKYIFEMEDGSEVIGMIKLQKKIGLGMSTIFYRVQNGKKIKGVKIVRHNI